MSDKLRLQDKVAVVTGGAFGIGRAIAERFAREGAVVAILDLEAEEAKVVAGGLPRSMVLQVDVTNEAAIEAGVAEVVDAYSGIDILVNNAGGAIIPTKPFWDMARAEWDFLLNLNLTSQWACAKAVLHSMRGRGGGRIINLASTGGLSGSPGHCAYGSAKGAVIVMTKTMARELGPFGINVNAIAPGYTRFTHPKSVFTAEQVREMEALIPSMQPLGRVGQPEDVAAAAAYLASDDGIQVTGHILVVDGGGSLVDGAGFRKRTDFESDTE